MITKKLRGVKWVYGQLGVFDLKGRCQSSSGPMRGTMPGDAGTMPA